MIWNKLTGCSPWHLQVLPKTGAMNKLKEMKGISVQAKWRLAAAYALAGQVQVAKDLIARETTDIPNYRGTYSSYGSPERDWAMILETLVILNDRTKGNGSCPEDFGYAVRQLLDEHQTTAYSCLPWQNSARESQTKKMASPILLEMEKRYRSILSNP